MVAVYVVYALIVVPLVEPSAKFRKSKAVASRPSARPRKLDHLFVTGSWELDRPKVIETDQGTLLFDEYEPMDDGRLKLTPCTVICYTEQGKKADSSLSTFSNSAPLESVRRAIVLRAVQGATLNFDRPLNLLKGEVGNLIGGRLDGEITITSPPSEEGRDDEILLVTRNVQLDAHRIWTPHEVRFRYGPNVGTGRDLTIYLGGSKQSGKSEKSGKPSIGLGGVKLLELVHLDRLDLHLNDSGLFGAAQGAKTAGQINGSRREASGAAQKDRAVQVTCRGPLRFDFDRQAISLEDHVDLMRHNLNGPSDQLLCQLLEIYFTDAPANTSKSNDSESKESKNATPNKLTPSKVVATGYPVIIRAASIGIGTRAERLEYDCILRRIWLKDRDKVMFQDRQHNIEAKDLLYTLETQGRLGDLVAVGPGVMHGIVGTRDQTMDIVWQDKVVSRRIENNPVVTFTSQVKIAVKGAGTFRADTLHLYLVEKPRTDDPNKFKLEPDRLHAIGNVNIETPNLSAKLNEAKLWFQMPDRSADEQDAISKSLAASSVASPFTTPGLPSGKDSSATGTKHFVLNGQLVEALVVVDKRPIVDRLVLRGDFKLVEDTSIGKANAASTGQLTVTGNLLELQEGASERPRAALLGGPAEVSARGMSIRGDRFHVYPADNVLDIVGPGDATFPPKGLADTNKSPTLLPASSPGKIRWKKQMHFDGEIASFEGSVVVNLNRPNPNGDYRGVAMGDVVQTRLTKRIDFRQPDSQGSVSLEELAFEGWGFFEVEQSDAAGQKKLSQQIQVKQLTINQTTGEIRGEGPGWLRGIHRGRVEQTKGAQMLPVSKSGLNFIRVDFAHTLAGNLHHRQLEFLQGTKTLYGPVDSWEDSLDKYADRDLPANAVVMTCDRLAVAQMDPENSTDQIEIEATGNARVEGSAFSATGGRISYAHAKDQIVLEGYGRTAATLAFQKQPGSPPSNVSAMKIMYWPSTKQFELDNLEKSNFFDVGQFRGIGAGVNKPR